MCLQALSCVFFFFPVPVVETLGIFNCFQCFRHTKKCILKS